jgi:D-lactate dehydrogenase (cytochrome)
MRVLTDPGDVALYLEDSAHYPGGSATAVYLPESVDEVAEIVRKARRVLPVGAQTSLTGGATPDGGVVLSFSRMANILEWSEGSVRVQAGTVLADLEAELSARDLYYPPVPTYDGATVGGTVATNAAGAATFKYGTTRDWVTALTCVLADGDVVRLRRGECLADADGRIEIRRLSGRPIVVSIPRYEMPDVPKCSAGYYARPGMDLVDLFIGSEGTLGVVAEVELRLLRGRPAWFCGFVPLADDQRAIALVAALRDASKKTWETKDPNGVDVVAVEYVDRRCLELLREDGVAAEVGFSWPDDTAAAILFQAELPSGATRESACDELARLDDAAHDGSLLRLCRILVQHGVFDVTVPVLPDDVAGRAALFRLREAVPVGVNRRVREKKNAVDPAISKSGGDVIVPFDEIGESLRRYREILSGRGLDHAIWGHVSDGNFHPNVISATASEMMNAREAQLEIGRAAIALGGCPMSEHGVGRNPVKQRLLVDLYGEDGVAQMISVKRALDPRGKLAPGVLFASV